MQAKVTAPIPPRSSARRGETIATRAGRAKVTRLERVGEADVIWADYGSGIPQPHQPEDLFRIGDSVQIVDAPDIYTILEIGKQGECRLIAEDGQKFCANVDHITVVDWLKEYPRLKAGDRVQIKFGKNWHDSPSSTGVILRILNPYCCEILSDAGQQFHLSVIAGILRTVNPPAANDDGPPLPTAAALQELLVPNDAPQTIAKIFKAHGFVEARRDDWLDEASDPDFIPYRNWAIETTWMAACPPDSKLCYAFANRDEWDYTPAGQQQAIAWLKQFVDRVINAAEVASGQLNLLKSQFHDAYLAEAKDLSSPEHAAAQRRRHSAKGHATGWIEQREGNLSRKKPTISYYYCWQNGDERGKQYIPVRQRQQIEQMVQERKPIEDILQCIQKKK